MKQSTLAAALSLAFASGAWAQALPNGTYQFTSGPGTGYGTPPFTVTGGSTITGSPAAFVAGVHLPNCSGFHVHGTFFGIADPGGGGCGHGIIGPFGGASAIPGVSGSLPGATGTFPGTAGGQLALTRSGFSNDEIGDLFMFAFNGATSGGTTPPSSLRALFDEDRGNASRNNTDAAPAGELFSFPTDEQLQADFLAGLAQAAGWGTSRNQDEIVAGMSREQWEKLEKGRIKQERWAREKREEMLNRREALGLDRYGNDELPPSIFDQIESDPNRNIFGAPTDSVTTRLEQRARDGDKEAQSDLADQRALADLEARRSGSTSPIDLSKIQVTPQRFSATQGAAGIEETRQITESRERLAADIRERATRRGATETEIAAELAAANVASNDKGAPKPAAGREPTILEQIASQDTGATTAPAAKPPAPATPPAAEAPDPQREKAQEKAAQDTVNALFSGNADKGRAAAAALANAPKDLQNRVVRKINERIQKIVTDAMRAATNAAAGAPRLN